MTDLITELWAVQVTEHPTSIRLTPEQVISWARMRGNLHNTRWELIAVTIQYPPGIWYTLDRPTNVWGFRYGTEAHEYISGFRDA